MRKIKVLKYSLLVLLFMMVMIPFVSAQSRGIKCSANGDFDYIKCSYQYFDSNDDEYKTFDWFLNDESYSIGGVVVQQNSIEVTVTVVIDTISYSGDMFTTFGDTTDSTIQDVTIYLTYDEFEGITDFPETTNYTLAIIAGAIGSVVIILVGGFVTMKER